MIDDTEAFDRMKASAGPRQFEEEERLLGLAHRCEQATGRDRTLEQDIHDAVFGDRLENPMQDDGSRIRSYTSSIDAALTLVPEGYRLQLSDWDHDRLREKGPWQAILTEAGSRDRGFDPAFKTRCEHAETLALAICAAALRARAEIGGEA